MAPWSTRLLWVIPLGPYAAVVTALIAGFLRILYFLLKPGAHLDFFLVMFNLFIAPFFALFDGAIGAVVFLLPAFLFASVIRSSRIGYGIAGAVAGLFHSLAARESVASVLHSEIGPELSLRQSLLGYRLMGLARDPVEIAITFVAAVAAGALAGVVYARIASPARPPLSY